jgi:hypothetical protein
VDEDNSADRRRFANPKSVVVMLHAWFTRSINTRRFRVRQYGGKLFVLVEVILTVEQDRPDDVGQIVLRWVPYDDWKKERRIS